MAAISPPGVNPQENRLHHLASQPFISQNGVRQSEGFILAGKHQAIEGFQVCLACDLDLMSSFHGFP